MPILRNMAPALRDYTRWQLESMPVLLQPTRSSISAATKSSIFGRQAPTVTVTVTSDSGSGNGKDSDTLTGGAIAGIVIGSIVGFLLLLWIFRSCFNLGAPPQDREFLYRDAEPKRRHHHSRRRRGHSHSSSLSMPPPVVVRSSSRSHRQPTYVYQEAHRGRSH